MKKAEIVIKYFKYNSIDELSETDRQLLVKAREAINGSYAPYSAFQVGAAVLLKNGEVILGSNQENVAYPSGLCAERVALFYASARYSDVPVEAIAITARSTDFEIEEPVTPCGSCRQVMAETENRFGNDIRVIMQGYSGQIYMVTGINNMLPLMFHAEKLKK
ncbi:MAG: cytidine deaminase [Bacteroidetes bacterium]|nr:cytidine deaminase [Bacteroidota bacterium]